MTTPHIHTGYEYYVKNYNDFVHTHMKPALIGIYHNEGKGFATKISDIYFNDITCQQASETDIFIQGFPSKKVSNVVFNNLTIHSAKKYSLSDTQNIVMNDVTIGEPATAPSFVRYK
ncbi:hypothetical protein [uncultured Sunxiuqinia sp.]|uniref:hypothetical protein n=1 Tax=uncultured Sunxiuqinia sp. TaxID=1573825 RepID=UPI002AA63AE8|nr:hypothetical protein [uncultured Sunxiuqinia sp.]